MDPEQGLAVIVEYFAVKFLVVFIAALVRVFCPERLSVTQGNRTLVDFYLIFLRGNLYLFLGAVFLFFFLVFCIFVDMLYDNIVIAQILLIDGFIFLRRVCFGEEDFHRHEGAVFFNDFSYTVFVGELQAVFVQIQGDLCSDGRSVSVLHRIFGAAVAFPVYRRRAFLIGKGVDVYVVGHHKCRVKAQSEMTDHLVCICLVFVFLQKFRRTGKGDLGNVFLHLIGSHTDTVIDKFQCFFFRVYDYLNAGFVIFGKLVFAHDVQLFQLGDGVAAVGDKFANENVMIGIHPFLYDWKNIIAVD